MESDKNSITPYSFPQKVWIAGSIIALIAILLMLAAKAFPILLLALAGAIIAVFFHGIAGFISRKTGLKDSWSLLISILATLIIIGGIGLLVGYKISAQLVQLTDTLPSTIEKAKSEVAQYPLGQRIVNRISKPENLAKMKSLAATFFKTSFGVAGDIYVVLFLAIFFTASPKTYRKGIIRLLPLTWRDKASHLSDTLFLNIQKWILGKLFAMLVVFILTATGLIILGIPMWLPLAIIAGCLNFIPNFGPVIAMVPAVLVAILQGPSTAGLVAGLYILVQVVESNFITPLAQQKLVNIPPALIISAQLIIGGLSGGWGIVLATPIVVIIMILVEELYIKKIEG